jgi:hypothetical protein
MFEKLLYELEDESERDYYDSDYPNNLVYINGKRFDIDRKYIPGMKTLDYYTL